MAFVRDNFAKSDTQYNSGLPQQWSYKGGADSAATVDTNKYYNEVVDLLKVGDTINFTNDAAEHGTMTVLSNDGTDVDVSDLDALGATDTD